MKKIIPLLAAVLFSLSLFGQMPFDVAVWLNSTSGGVANYPVWLKVIPTTGSPYLVSGLTDATGHFTDTNGVPAGSQVVSIAYDCNGNPVMDTVTVTGSWGSDTVMIACAGNFSHPCDADIYMRGSSQGLNLAVTDSIFSHKLGTANKTLIWSFGDGTSDTLSSTSSTLNHSYSSAGEYQLCLDFVSYDSIAGITTCGGTQCETITVGSPAGSCTPPTIGDSVSTQYLYTVDFQVTSNGPQLGGSTYVFEYDFGDGNTRTVTTASNVDASVSHTYSSNGTYTVTVTETRLNSFGDTICSAYDSVNVALSSSISCQALFGVFGHNGNAQVRDSSNFLLPPGTFPRFIIDYGNGVVDTTTSTSNSYQYTNVGTYSICYTLEVVDSANGAVLCSDMVCQNFTANFSCNLGVADSTVLNSTNGFFRIHVSGGGSGTTSYAHISFGDGTSDSSAPIGQLFSHNYPALGHYGYTVSVARLNTMGDTVCTDTKQGVVSVGIDHDACSANFTASQPGGAAVQFSSTSSIPAGVADTVYYNWNFGDGHSSMDENPTHTYAAGGSYTACLDIFMVNAQQDTLCASSYCDSIAVSSPPSVSCTALFNSSSDTINPLLIYFSNQSTTSGAPAGSNVVFHWDYGDGSTGTSSAHTYAAPGTYNVCLTVSVLGAAIGDTLCNTTLCQNVTVSGPPYCKAEYIVDTANSFFGEVYIWNISEPLNSDSLYTNSFLWDFGDGSTSTQPFPTHTYAQHGMYEVCVTITSTDQNQNVCTDTFCDSLGVDAQGNLIYKSTNTGFTLNVLNPESLGQEDASPFAEVEVYPNPASDVVVIDMGSYEGNLEWRVTDLKGALVQQDRSLNKDRITINVETLTPGLYILTLMNEEFPASRHKLIIDR